VCVLLLLFCCVIDKLSCCFSPFNLFTIRLYLFVCLFCSFVQLSCFVIDKLPCCYFSPFTLRLYLCVCFLSRQHQAAFRQTLQLADSKSRIWIAQRGSRSHNNNRSFICFSCFFLLIAMHCWFESIILSIVLCFVSCRVSFLLLLFLISVIFLLVSFDVTIYKLFLRISMCVRSHYFHWIQSGRNEKRGGVFV
jgi:hypothetical protein